jgi:hypothetical protein
VLRYSGRYTLGSALDRLQMKRRQDVCRLFYQLVEVGIDSLDIVVDDVVSLPVWEWLVSIFIFLVFVVSCTSASRFQSLLTSGACSLHCSPIILDISGFASPGCWATTCAW